MISYKYCKKVNNVYSDCKDKPTSTDHTQYCKFYGNTNTKECETLTSATKNCTNNTAGENCNAGSVVKNNYSCPTINNIIAGTCDKY